MLPLVSRIVRDIVDANGRMHSTYLAAQRHVQAGETDAAEELQDRLQDIAFERGEFVEELERLGVELKDPAIGLVDFPARLGDRVVYLCWKLGEERVEHWHELQAGFSGREPIAGNFLAEE